MRERARENPVHRTRIQSRWVENKRNSRARKRETIRDDSSDTEARRNADRMARMREAEKAKKLERSVEERADILKKIQHRYHLLQWFCVLTNVT